MKLLKIIIWLLGLAFLGVLAAAVIFALTFDPNRYKDDVERLVKERTGRTLQLKGPLELAFWPSLGAKVSGVSLSEHGAEEQFLSLDSAHASVELLPLLRGELVVDRLRVSGLKAQVVKGKDGRFNFQDLIEGGKPAEPQPPAKDGPGRQPVAFDIAGVQLERSSLTYRDLMSGQQLVLDQLDLQTGRIAENAEGEIDFSAQVKRRQPPLEATLALNGRYSLKPEALAVDFSSKLDESTVKGKVAIARAAQMSYDFDLDIDRINLDRYLGAPEKAGGEPGPAKKGGKPDGNEDTPVDLSGLKGVNARGLLHIGSLQVQGMKLANLKTEVRASGGKVEIGPHSASLYEGSMAGTLSLDGNANRVALKETLTNIAVGPLLRDLAEQERLEGRGSVALDVNAGGATVNAMKRSLAGTAKAQLRDGAIKGFDIGALLRKARTALGSQSTQSAQNTDRTDFSELSASFTIKNGVARNDDLEVKAPLFRANGAGQIDIARSTIDYTVKASVVATTQGQGGRELEQLAGLTVPVHLSGPFDDLKYQVDYRAVASEAAKSKVGEQVKQRVDKQRDRLEGEVRDRLKGLLRR